MHWKTCGKKLLKGTDFADDCRATGKRETSETEIILASENICRINAQDFCRQVVRQSRRNANAFQGFDAPLGGKKTSNKLQILSLASISETTAMGV